MLLTGVPENDPAAPHFLMLLVKAHEFADAMPADLRLHRSREDINPLPNRRTVRVRTTRIAEAHADIHRELQAAFNSHITDVTLIASR